MGETVKRLRETGARLALVIGTIYVLMSLVRFGGLLRRHSLADSAHQIGGSSLSIVMVLVLVSVLLSCVTVRPVTPRARGLLRAGAVLIGVAVLIEVVFLVLGLAISNAGGVLGSVLEVLGAVLDLSLKGAAVWLLWRASSGAPEPAREAVEPTAGTAGESVVKPAVQPASWSADTAAGAVWTRAGDAASGAAASGWGQPGHRAQGWEIAPEAPHVERPALTGPWATAGQLANSRSDQTAATELPDPLDSSSHPAPERQWQPTRGDGVPARSWSDPGAAGEQDAADDVAPAVPSADPWRSQPTQDSGDPVRPTSGDDQPRRGEVSWQVPTQTGPAEEGPRTVSWAPAQRDE